MRGPGSHTSQVPQIEPNPAHTLPLIAVGQSVKQATTEPMRILIQRLARFATLFVVDEGAFGQSAHIRYR
jgi:hypothetical protein